MDVCETKAKEDDATVRPRRFALQYNPPTLVVEYSQGKGPRRRLFHQRIHLKAVSHVLSTARVASKLRLKYPDILSVKYVSDAQLERLVGMLLSNGADKDKDGRGSASPSAPGSTFLTSLASPSDDSPAKTDAPVRRQAPLPPLSVSLSAATPAASLAPAASSSTATLGRPRAASAPTDSGVAARSAVAGYRTADSGPKAPGGTAASAMPSAADSSGSSSAGGVDARALLPDVDLQRVAPAEVVKVKQQMDVVFEMNRKVKGDEGYVYNVEVDFEEGVEPNEWDSD